MLFDGTSWLIADVREFGGPVLDLLTDETAEASLYGLAVEGFGGPRWFDADGKPSVSHYLDLIPDRNRERIACGLETLIFDMSNEGPLFQADWMAVFHASLSSYNIPTRQCVLLQQNRCFERYYHNWAISRDVDPIRTLVYDHYPRRMAGLLYNQEFDRSINVAGRSKMFLCLNFTPRDWRVGFVSWLLAGGFDRLGYVSFSRFESAKQELGAPSVPNWFPEMETTLRGLAMLKNRVPMTLDLDPAGVHIPEYDIGDSSLYSNAYFSIVTESEISSGDVVRVTEKVIKPLAMMHPIIIFGNPHSLSILKDLGFRTFSEIFDESYDEIEDPTARTAAVMVEVARILALPVDELHTAYHSIQPTLLHNALVARRHLNDQYCYKRQPELMSKIMCAI